MRYDEIKELPDEKFRRLVGVRKHTFEKMFKIIRESDSKKKKRGGRKNKLIIEDRLLMALEYMREYRTYFHISKSYGLAESTTYDTIKWIENTLIKHPDFALPGKKELLKNTGNHEAVLIDATETPIQRPKKKQQHYYSGKKKRHTIKTQIIVCAETGEVISTAFANGKCHDFRLLKESKTNIDPKVKVVVDTGYQGLQKLHKLTEIPKKKSKNKPLTKEDKIKNRAIASYRVLNENVIGALKRFRIIAEKYRNRRKRFGLRFNLIAGIYNMELEM